MTDDGFELDRVSEQLRAYSSTKRQRLLRMLAQAALGSVPWVGGFMGAMATYRAEEDQSATDSLQAQWLEEHAKKIRDLAATLGSILDRLDSFGDTVMERVESEEYLQIVRKGFSDWDSASTEQKRQLIVKLMTNAGVSSVCSDDVIRLFQDWISHYHEIHFAVIGCVFQHPGWTRSRIWTEIRGRFPREDSAEADLFKLLIRDLSTGGIIRQHRQTDYRGNFIKKQTTVKTKSNLMKSAFDNQEPYELTELGRQFVHYTMEELVPRLADRSDQ